jgi:hypothetical protein
MARIHQDGFEFNSTTANVATYDTITNVTMGTTNVRTGARAAQITSLASGVARGLNKKYQTAAATNNFLRIYIFIVTYPSANNQIMNFSNTTSLGSGQRCSISLSSTGTLKLFNAVPTQIGSDSAVLSLNTWYRVELRCDTTNASGSRTAAAALDGTIFATSSTEALGGTASSVSIGGNLLLEAQTTGNWWFDDLALNDGTGSFQTSYPGSGKILQLYPNAAGDINGYLVQVGGTAGSANNYTRVNEIPPDDATSYNASAVLNAEDLFNVTDSGMGAGDTVNVVAVGGRFADITGADATSGIKFEIIKTSGGTKSQSANIVPNSTGWNTNGTASPRLYPIILYNDPDGSAWTQATVDSMQIGYTLDAVAVQAVGITNIWASVDYTPAAAAGTTHNLSLLGVGS